MVKNFENLAEQAPFGKDHLACSRQRVPPVLADQEHAVDGQRISSDLERTRRPF